MLLSKTKTLYGLFAVLLAVIGVFVGYLFVSYLRLAMFTPAQIDVPMTPSEQPSQPQQPGEQPGQPLPPEPNALEVTWQAPEKIEIADDIGHTTTLEENGYVYTSQFDFYRVGAVKAGAYSGAEVLVAQLIPEGPMFELPMYRLLKQGSNYVVLTKQSDDFSYAIDTDKVSLDAEHVLPGFNVPETFVDAKTGYTFKRDATVREFYHPSGLKFAFHQPGVGDLSTSDPAAFDESTPWRNRQHGFTLRMPDGTIAVYAVVYEFFNAEGVPQFSFGNGQRNTTAYHYTELTSCGSSNYANVVAPADAQNLALLEVGATADGVKIMTYKDVNHPDLQKDYGLFYVPEGETKMTYEQYVMRYPYLFFTDKVGRLIKMRNAEFTPAAECGKPVIYLYPERTQDVSVFVTPQGGFTFTEPDYGNGWNVTAHPDGVLTNTSDGKTYPYLFWEGRGGIYQSQMEQGFVVARAEVEAFLTDSLAQLGLNTQETADFLEFWLPRMQADPYYFITFYGKETMDALAPLTVEPKPDTIIRILMDFTGLQAPIEARPYPLRAPAREGFTVVEWGGVIK